MSSCRPYSLVYYCSYVAWRTNVVKVEKMSKKGVVDRLGSGSFLPEDVS